METLRELPNIEALEDAGLLNRKVAMRDDQTDEAHDSIAEDNVD